MDWKQILLLKEAKASVALEHPPVSFDEYLTRVASEIEQHPDWRAGQTFFNVLAEVRPDISETYIRAQNGIDPFYRDNVIPAFLNEVYQRW